MTRFPFLLALLILAPLGTATAQGFAWDASFGAAEGRGRSTVGVRWTLPVGRLTLGVGPRLSYYFAGERSYPNRDGASSGLPARVTIDPSIVGLNIRVQSDLALVGPIGVGANIDLAGVAAGPQRTSGTTALTVARGSLLLFGTSDRGSLNSEFFAAVRVSRSVTVRAGMSHYVTSYRGEAGSARARYSRFETVPFISLEGSL